MDRTVKQFDLRRVAGTELQVVSDIEGDVQHVIEAEGAVIGRYVELGTWRHDHVDLFILHDLQPLSERLTAAGSLPPGGYGAMDRRPVMNAYDLADLSSCHVFVNQSAMVKEGFWDDPACLCALLAHEHAHPLSENQTTRASRDLHVLSNGPASATDGTSSAPAQAAGPTPHGGPGLQTLPVQTLVALMAEKLCCYAPRELFANDLVVASGFDRELFALDQRVVNDAAAGIAGRDDLAGRLALEVKEGRLSAARASGLSLVGDMHGYLDIALEIAPFRRTGHAGQASELEAVLEEKVFPQLKPGVADTYRRLCEMYVELRPDLDYAGLVSWGTRVLDLLSGTLRSGAMSFDLSVDHSADEEGTHV